MKNRRYWKLLIFSVAATLIAFAAVNGSLAWLTDSDHADNSFTPASVTCTVEEYFDGHVKSDVTVRNTGNIGAFIRVALAAVWKNTDGTIAAVVPVQGTDYQLTWNTQNWLLGTDGYYYCKTAVAPNDETPVFIDECTVSTSLAGCRFELQIVASAIQYDPPAAVESAWPAIQVTEAGVLTAAV